MDNDSQLALAHQRYRLRGAHVTISALDLLHDPALLELAADDAAWSFGYEEWRRRKPSRLRKAHHQRWLEDGQDLFAERHQLFLKAKEFGV